MRLVGCVNLYQDAEFIRRFLPVLREKVDFLVCVDGAYEGFPQYDAAHSTDGSLDVVSQYADLLVQAPRGPFGESRPWENEIVKRSAYLVGKPDDWYFVVDADECLTGTPDRDVIASRTDWLVELQRVNDTIGPYGIHRCFAHRPGIRYSGTHHAVHVFGEIIHPERIPKDFLPGVRLDHYQMSRDQDRVERKGVYYRALAEAEGPFRKENGL